MGLLRGTCVSHRVPATSNDGICFSWWASAPLYTPYAASLSPPDLPRAAGSPLKRAGVTVRVQVGQRMKRMCGQTVGNCQVSSATQCPEGLGKRWCARFLALTPGGPIATRFLAPSNTVLQVGTTVFAHGGVLPEHIAYGLHRINAETSAWMRGCVHTVVTPRLMRRPA
jgi:hypothetical protein